MVFDPKDHYPCDSGSPPAPTTVDQQRIEEDGTVASAPLSG